MNSNVQQMLDRLRSMELSDNEAAQLKELVDARTRSIARSTIIFDVADALTKLLKPSYSHGRLVGTFAVTIGHRGYVTVSEHMCPEMFLKDSRKNEHEKNYHVGHPCKGCPECYPDGSATK